MSEAGIISRPLAPFSMVRHFDPSCILVCFWTRYVATVGPGQDIQDILVCICSTSTPKLRLSCSVEPFRIVT